jgi:peptidoglycan/LPS O-acetylase OafA/YrhL
LWLLPDHEMALKTWPQFGARLVAFAITVGLSKLSWDYLEKPIVRWSQNWKYSTTGNLRGGSNLSAREAIIEDESKSLDPRPA